jgi:hypothetical protein
VVPGTAVGVELAGEGEDVLVVGYQYVAVYRGAVAAIEHSSL